MSGTSIRCVAAQFGRLDGKHSSCALHAAYDHSLLRLVLPPPTADSHQLAPKLRPYLLSCIAPPYKTLNVCSISPCPQAPSLSPQLHSPSVQDTECVLHLTLPPSSVPISSATRCATVTAATRRGCVQAMAPP